MTELRQRGENDESLGGAEAGRAWRSPILGVS
jgi:hypothetical protein